MATVPGMLAQPRHAHATAGAIETLLLRAVAWPLARGELSLHVLLAVLSFQDRPLHEQLPTNETENQDL
eukprot:6160921-Lingulodinium_polyedra.AAC.1